MKSAKKHVKNVKLKLLMVKKIIDDPKKQKCGQELIPNARFQRWRVFVRNDLVERKIKSRRVSSKKF